MTLKLSDLSLKSASEGLSCGEFSSVELTEASLQAMEDFRSLNMFITETPDLALEQAHASDARRRKGETLGVLDGLPIANKDLFCTEGVLTTAGSHILHDFVPSYESTVTGNLKSAGTIMVGKLNLDEFAMGSAGLTSYYKPAVNPWKRESPSPRVPGGSSSGSAAAVSARVVLGATGTDTGGSIRQPAAFTGIVGMKPTYGRCSRFGIVAFASSLDQAGPMTTTVEDSALMLNVMAGHDAKDSTSSPRSVPDFTKSLEQGVAGMRIGIPKEYKVDGMPEELLRFWERGALWLQEEGAEVVEVSLPYTRYALPVYYIIAPAEASANLARYDGVRYGLRIDGETLDDMYMNTRREGFGSEVRRRIMIGTYVLSSGFYDAYYTKAQRVRRLIVEDFHRVFSNVDLLLTPTAPTAAFGFEKKEKDTISMYLNDIFTVPISLAGLPAISVPCSLDSEGLPLGLQLVGRHWEEESVFRGAHILEQRANFNSLPQAK